MKKLILISALLFSFNGSAYNETDLAKFKALNACKGCDLSGVELSGAELSGANLNDAKLEGADLRGVDLSDTYLRDAKLDGAKFCKTQMPWGEVNDDCEE